MLSRLFSRGMQLQVGGRRVELRSPDDMDAFLRGRTGLSSRRVETLGRLDDVGLARETEHLGRVQQRIEQLLRAGGEEYLQLGELSDVPEDQDWRDILDGLRADGEQVSPYRLVALRRFAEYLATEQVLLRSLRGAAHAERRVRDPEDTFAGPRQKLICDLDLIEDQQSGTEELARLPKGETIAIAMQPHQSLSLVLARYRFVLVSGSPFLLVDDSGHDVKLAPGKIVVGRSGEADVTLDGGYRAVSRRHLMVETGNDGCLRLTDISSLGTFVPKEHLGKTLH